MEVIEGEIIHSKVKGIGVRHGQVLLQFFFYVILFGIQLSLALTLFNVIESLEHNSDMIRHAVISQVMQAYMIGFLITGLFGGFVCNKYGFKWPMIILMVVISAVTLNLATISKEYGYQGLMVCRVIQGLSAGIIFPMPADFINKWIPVNERTRLGTAIYASAIFGTAVISFGAPIISASGLGWQFVYDQYGYLAIIWAILMAIFGANSPEEYTGKITDAEFKYIVQNRGNAKPKSKLKIPWRRLLSSPPFWAIVVAQIGANWMLFTISLNMSLYMQQFFNLTLTPNIFVLISLITWVMSFVISAIAELLINEGKTTITQSRKLFNSIGSLIPASFFLILLLKPTGPAYLGVFIWTIVSVASVGTICGSKLNSNDISSNFSSIIFGTATWFSIAFNVVFIQILQIYGFGNWMVLFSLTAILVVLTNAFFLKFGSGEEQEWEAYEDLEDEEIDLSKSSTYVSCEEGKYLLFVKKQ